MSSRILPYIGVLRPGNSVMSFIAVLVGSFIILKTLNPFSFIAATAAFLITGAGNVINDYVDIEADKINKPKRPIPSGKIKPKSALIYSVSLFLIGLLLAIFTTFHALVLASANSALLVIYAIRLKNRMFIGNAVVSYMVGSTILFGSLASMPTSSVYALQLPILLMALSGIPNFSRELVKTLEDLEGDKLGFIKKALEKAKRKLFEKFRIEEGSVKFKYSEKSISSVAVAGLLAAVLLSPLPYMLGFLGYGYLAFLIPTNISFILGISTLLHSKNKKKYTNASKLIKIGMLFGLLAYIAGIVY